MKCIILISCTMAALCFVTDAWSALPDLTPVGLQVPPVITGEPNPTVTINWSVTNQGTEDAGQHYDGIYLSTDAALHDVIGQICGWYVPGPIAPGAVNWGSNS